jgi:hypothetical protein
VRHVPTNLADSLSQYSKHSDDITDLEIKGKMHGGLGITGVQKKTDKFIKTQKKLPDLKMGSDHHNTSIGTIQKSHIGVNDSNEIHSVSYTRKY